MYFSPKSIFYLKKMQTFVKGATGKKYRLANKEDLLDLLIICSETTEQDLKNFYSKFKDACSSESLTTLEETVEKHKKMVRKSA